MTHNPGILSVWSVHNPFQQAVEKAESEYIIHDIGLKVGEMNRPWQSLE